MAHFVHQRRLTICVDDVGLHAGINQAALALAEQGRIGALSCMVAAPAWSAGAAAIAGIDPRRVDVGLHLDLTQHTATSSCRMPLARWIARGPLGLFDAGRLRGEIDAQLDRFEAALGRPPAHVDGHRHVHQLPGVREVLVAVLAERYAGRLPWLRSTRAPGLPPPRLKARIIQALGERGLRRLCRLGGLRQNEHLLGVYGFDGGGERYLALLFDWLQAAGDGDVLMCHPSCVDTADPRPGARRWEYEVLAGAPFGALLSMSGIRVAPLPPQTQ